MEIKASEVQKLRQMTGAGLMDCKKALSDSNGDIEKAIQILREQGIAKSSKRADRVAAEGLIATWLSADQKEGIIIELNCETDFVARNEEFIQMGKTICEAVQKNPSWTSADQFPADQIKNLSAKTGEKIEFRRFERMKSANGIVTSYIHPGAKLGVLVQIDSDKATSQDSVKELGRELAIQVAGANPTYVSRNDVPKDVIEKEKDIFKKQMEGQKKPADILEKIAVGKLQQYYEAQCLLDQPHVRDAAGKTKIQDLVDGVARKENLQLKVARFVRFRVGAD
jgi:elongation factor Ts